MSTTIVNLTHSFYKILKYMVKNDIKEVTISVVIYQNTMKKELKKLGLESKEAKIYLACLQTKDSNPAYLVRQTKIKRSTIYFYLAKLKEKGLIETKIKEKRKYFNALNPKDSLQTLLNEQKKEVIKKGKLIQKLIPMLKNIKPKSYEKTVVNYLHGITGLRQLIDKIISENKDIYCIGSNETIFNVINQEEYFKILTLPRMKQNTKLYMLTNKDILKSKRFGESLGSFRNYKFIESIEKIPAVLLMFGSNIAILSKDNNESKIVLINDKTISKIMQFTFKLLWSKIE